jgi:outer membrane immunogenic protein
VNTKLLFASVAALVIATPAMAQDDSGFKGGARIEARVGVDDVVLKSGGSSESEIGLAYGTELGYDYATKSGFVIGAYAGIEGATTKECATVTVSQRFCLKAGRNITVGVRAGGIVAGGLLYAKGGYTNGRVTASVIDSAVPANNVSASDSADGYHLGAGYEFSISAHTYAKIEYVYTHYSVDNTLGSTTGLQRHQGMAGFGYRF